MLRSILCTSITFAYILLLGPPLLLYAFLTGNSDPLYETARVGAKMALWLAGARVKVEGLEKIPRGRAVIFMPNHLSNADAPALVGYLPQILALVKKEFFRVPVLGRAMHVRGFVLVDRKNRERAIAAVRQAAEKLRAGYSFLAFPEGTRSPDGRLQRFKKGVFFMAIEAGAPIVPVSLTGTQKIMRKGEWRMYPGPVRLVIHDPVPTEGYTPDAKEELMEKVRAAILSGLTDEERPLSPTGRPASEGHSQLTPASRGPSFE